MIVFGTMSPAAAGQRPPAIDFPTIQVQANLPGASPETMASAVALPLEKQFATIAGLDSINSTSSQGFTTVTLQFSLSRNIDAAAQDVQSMIARVTRQLPAQMPAPPSYQKVNPGDDAVMQLVLRSNTLPISQIDEYAESTVAQRISMVTGWRRQVGGAASTRCVSIWIRATSRRTGSSTRRRRDPDGQREPAHGNDYGADHTYTIFANGQLLRASDIDDRHLSQWQPGSARRHRARLRRHRERQVANWFNGQRHLTVVQKQPGTNVVAVVDAVSALLLEFRAIPRRR
jgi:HAE1 family hydrophobic/amphiphilic exporter-1